MVTLLLALLFVLVVGQVDGMITLPHLPRVRVLVEVGQLRFGLTTVHRRRAYYRVAFG